jgi:hypothetical protein
VSVFLPPSANSYVFTKMRRSDTSPLRQWLGRTGGLFRYIWGAHESVALPDLAGGSSFGRQVRSLRGRSVVVVTREQITADLAMIELDGIARRIVICPPDVTENSLHPIVSTVEVDAVVSDGAAPELEALGVTLAPYKVPAVVHLVPALPVSASGKLLRHA